MLPPCLIVTAIAMLNDVTFLNSAAIGVFSSIVGDAALLIFIADTASEGGML